MKHCKSCNISKPEFEFYKRSNNLNNTHSKCIVCFKAASKKLRQNTPKRCLEYQKKWRKTSSGRLHGRKKQSEWRARKNQAIPKWLTKEQKKQIQEIYNSCPEGYQVDHIIPLRGINVKGLHVPWNLQHLSAQENRKKHNKVIS